jgi:hypothetical protein
MCIFSITCGMSRISWLVPMALVAVTSAALGQSLGDVARQARQKEKPKAKAAKKVVTNDDIPESPSSATGLSEPGANVDALSASDKSPGPRTAREWRHVILEQKDRIETLQAQIDKLADSIHFVTANAYVNGAEYNQYQVRKQQEVKKLKSQLDEQWKKLSEMQEAAKQEGMGAAVYDP